MCGVRTDDECSNRGLLFQWTWPLDMEPVGDPSEDNWLGLLICCRRSFGGGSDRTKWSLSLSNVVGQDWFWLSRSELLLVLWRRSDRKVGGDWIDDANEDCLWALSTTHGKKVKAVVMEEQKHPKSEDRMKIEVTASLASEVVWCKGKVEKNDSGSKSKANEYWCVGQLEKFYSLPFLPAMSGVTRTRLPWMSGLTSTDLRGVTSRCLTCGRRIPGMTLSNLR